MLTRLMSYKNDKPYKLHSCHALIAKFYVVKLSSVITCATK